MQYLQNAINAIPVPPQAPLFLVWKDHRCQHQVLTPVNKATMPAH